MYEAFSRPSTAVKYVNYIPNIILTTATAFLSMRCNTFKEFSTLNINSAWYYNGGTISL